MRCNLYGLRVRLWCRVGGGGGGGGCGLHEIIREERGDAAQWAKDERRARLVARLCDVSATIADARAMGYCLPGIEAFQSHHHIGDSAPLRALLATGNAAAVRLALAVARKVRRTEAAAA